MKSKSDKLLDHFEDESIPNPKFMISVRLKHMCRYQFLIKLQAGAQLCLKQFFCTLLLSETVTGGIL